jgi:hypothetical protein
MIVLEKSAAKSHRAVSRSKGLSPRPLIRSGRAACSTVKPESARESTTFFAEDFYWEHSSASVSVLLMAIPNSDSVETAGQNQHENRFRSPNCVYVG